VSWEGEFAYHGIPSGVDNTASCYGGLMIYQVKDEQKTFERIQVKKPFEVVLANSGVTANTAALDGLTEKENERNPELFSARLKTITDQVLEMKKGIETGKMNQVGALMSENHKILIDMGLSHEKLIYLCNMALEKGALGAKLTGGGMGGYMVALTPGKDLQETVASAIEKEGFAVIRAILGGN